MSTTKRIIERVDSNLLRSIRLTAELTQAQVGERIGKPQSVVSRLERQSDVHLSTFLRFVRACGVRVLLDTEARP